MTAIAVMIANKNGRMKMSSEKQLILIILVAVVIFGWQLWKDKKKNDYWKKYRRSQGWE